MREAVVSATVSILHTYRKMCASKTAAGQLILPETLKLLPLYALSLTKHALLRAGTDVRADEVPLARVGVRARARARARVRVADVHARSAYPYPYPYSYP